MKIKNSFKKKFDGILILNFFKKKIVIKFYKKVLQKFLIDRNSLIDEIKAQ